MPGSAEYQKEWRLQHKEHLQKYGKEYRQKNLDKVREQSRNSSMKYSSDKKKVNWRKYAYGITKEEYDNLLVASNNKCAICGNEFEPTRRNEPCIDHDHETQQIRGLLCRYCNIGLGHFKDDPEVLEKAAIYLRRN